MARLDEVNVWTLLQLEAAVTNKTLDSFLEYVRGHFGLAGAVYTCLGFPGRSLDDPFLATADRTAWADRYVAFDYAALDPTLSVGARTLHPVDWVRRPLWKKKGPAHHGRGPGGRAPWHDLSGARSDRRSARRLHRDLERKPCRVVQPPAGA